MTRTQWIAQMRQQLADFDSQFAAEFPTLGEPGDETEGMNDEDWLEQFLIVTRETE